MVESRLLTTQEVAQALRKSPHQIRRWIKEGLIKGVQVGRTWRIPASELDRILREGLRGREG